MPCITKLMYFSVIKRESVLCWDNLYREKWNAIWNVCMLLYPYTVVLCFYCKYESWYAWKLFNNGSQLFLRCSFRNKTYQILLTWLAQDQTVAKLPNVPDNLMVYTGGFLLPLLYLGCVTNGRSIPFDTFLICWFRVIRLLFCVFWSLHKWRTRCETVG